MKRNFKGVGKGKKRIVSIVRIRGQEITKHPGMEKTTMKIR